MIDLLALTDDTLDRAGIAHRRSSVIALNRSTADRAAFAAVVFVDDEPAPSVFLKATPDPDAGAELRREFGNLETLHRAGPDALARTVPAPLHLGRHGTCTVIAESMLSGRRMKNLPPGPYFASRAFRDHFASILSWLESFHACPGADAVAVGHDPATVFGRYRDAFARSAALDRLLDETADHLAGATLPRSPWHGDFCTANILVRPDGGVGVIDWEHPLVRTWPLLDLLHCVSSFRITRWGRGDAARAENFRRLHFGAHPLRDVVRDGVLGHAGAIGVGAADILPLSVLAWASYANLKHRAQGGLRPPAGSPTQWPLIMFEDDRCLNLEMLADLRDDYLWNAAG